MGLLHQLDACNDEIRDQFFEWHKVYFERAVAVFRVVQHATFLFVDAPSLIPSAMFTTVSRQGCLSAGFSSKIQCGCLIEDGSSVFSVQNSLYAPSCHAREVDDITQALRCDSGRFFSSFCYWDVCTVSETVYHAVSSFAHGICKLTVDVLTLCTVISYIWPPLARLM